jgi:Zn-dependent peptidase ImmA (M78 family)
VKQLRKLADVYRRAFPVFYLPAPPEDLDALPDLRRVFHVVVESGETVDPDQFGPEMWLAIREAVYRADHFEEVLAGGDAWSLSVDPCLPVSSAAERIRAHLGVTVEAQLRGSDGYSSLRLWRTAAYDAHVLVFQFSGVDVEEARGFSIGGRRFPVVGLNSKDSPFARVFSLAHELAHIAVGPDADETYCNGVAARVLAPDEVLRELVARSQAVRGRDRWNKPWLNRLSRSLGVSTEVVARRLVDVNELGLVDYQDYRRHLQSLPVPQKAKGSGGPTFYVTRVSQVGRQYVQDLRAACAAGLVSPNDASRLLGVRGTQLEKVWAEVA